MYIIIIVSLLLYHYDSFVRINIALPWTKLIGDYGGRKMLVNEEFLLIM